MFPLESARLAQRRHFAAVALFAWGFTVGCTHSTARSSPPVAAVSTPEPQPPQPLQPTASIASVPATPPVAPPQPLANLEGDDKLPEPWRTRFRAWLARETKPPYIAVTRVQVISNAVSVVLQRRSEVDGVCLQGPSKLDLIQYEGTPKLTHEVQDFGDDCCPGTECVRTPQGWNLHYFTLLAAHDWKQLSLLVPAKQKLVWTINGGEEPTIKLTRKQVAAGQLRQALDCGLIYYVPSCDDRDASDTSFTCRCDAGGHHVTYDWQREGAAFVLVNITEESH